MTAQPVAFTGARLVDPATGYDGPGALLVRDGLIADVQPGGTLDGLSADIRLVDAGGAMLCPGLIDLRVKTGEPGSEPKETLKSAALAAARGGVTSMVVQPDTDPVIDDPSVADFILRRARDIGLVHVYPAGAATKGLKGLGMAEIGLMAEAGCVYVTDADRPIVDSKVMRRLMAYSSALGVLVSHRPADPWLTDGAAATESEFAGRLGLPASPVAAETIMLERDLALAGLTGARLIVDQISAAAPLASLARAKAAGLNVLATASINHLTFNELDIGDYRTFWKLTPPLRAESDRQALIEALASGLVDIVVSAHAPAPPEDKRLPFDEAAPGSVGLETLLSGLLALHHNGSVPLITLIRAVTLAPAMAIGLAAGRLAVGAPADLVLCDLDAPRLVDAEKLVSKSKNSAFDGRRLQGIVLMTLVDGRVVFEAPPVTRRIVIVSGAPGAGKTTLAAPLARILGLPLIAKDMIKETLAETLANPGLEPRAWSRALGGAAMEVLWTLAEAAPAAVLEANFRPHSGYEKGRLEGLAAHVVEVHCQCPPAEAMRRHNARALTPSRHPIHVTARLAEADLAEFDGPMAVGEVIVVDTLQDVDLPALAARVNRALDCTQAASSGRE